MNRFLERRKRVHRKSNEVQICRLPLQVYKYEKELWKGYGSKDLKLNTED